MTKRTVKITFTGKDKRMDVESIASAVAKTIRKGGMKDDKRKEIS